MEDLGISTNDSNASCTARKIISRSSPQFVISLTMAARSINELVNDDTIKRLLPRSEIDQAVRNADDVSYSYYIS